MPILDHKAVIMSVVKARHNYSLSGAVYVNSDSKRNERIKVAKCLTSALESKRISWFYDVGRVVLMKICFPSFTVAFDSSQNISDTFMYLPFSWESLVQDHKTASFQTAEDNFNFNINRPSWHNDTASNWFQWCMNKTSDSFIVITLSERLRHLMCFPTYINCLHSIACDVFCVSPPPSSFCYARPCCDCEGRTGINTLIWVQTFGNSKN